MQAVKEVGETVSPVVIQTAEYRPIPQKDQDRIHKIFKAYITPKTLKLIDLLSGKTSEEKVQITIKEESLTEEDLLLLNVYSRQMQELAVALIARASDSTRPPPPLEHLNLFSRRLLVDDIAKVAGEIREVSKDFIPNLKILEPSMPFLMKALVHFEDVKKAPRCLLEDLKETLTSDDPEKFEAFAMANQAYAKSLRGIFKQVRELSGRERRGLIIGLNIQIGELIKTE